MPSQVDILERQIVPLEIRARVDLNILEQGGSPWRTFRENSKVLRPDVTATIERAFDCDGFVAGGCARWLRSLNGEVTALKRGTYVHEGGDIDLFFRTMNGWREFVEPFTDFTDNHSIRPRLSLSQGKLAVNLTFASTANNQKPSRYSDPPKIQAICCTTGSPDNIIRTFDFHNSMVAFDREKTWIIEDWERIENEKLLKVSWWGSRSIAFRVSKYMCKYGYRKLVNASDAMFEQLVAGTNSMSEKQKITSRSKWMENLHFDVCDLETKLLILASTAKGIDTDDLFTLTKNNVKKVWVGSYEHAIRNLLERQERSNNPGRHESWDSVGFSADEYCWA